jgi:hypothetical protein
VATLRRNDQAHPSNAVLIGVDLGPNLSVTDLLATILWLLALHKDAGGALGGEMLDVSFWKFLKIGAVALPSALFAAQRHTTEGRGRRSYNRPVLRQNPRALRAASGQKASRSGKSWFSRRYLVKDPLVHGWKKKKGEECGAQ